MSKGKILQFYLRRIHGVTGIFPIGYFLLFHLKEGQTFAEKGLVLSIIFLWLPLLYHSLYGLFITYEGGMNVCCYRYVRNYMYFLQRLTGLLIIIFLALHIYMMKFGGYDGGSFSNFVLFSGVVISIFHLSNGLFGFLMDMGITIGEKAQKVAVAISFVLFFSLALYGITKYFNFVG
ncbi:MAG: succinate dehydrogenase cytochrome B558 [bacterium]